MHTWRKRGTCIQTAMSQWSLLGISDGFLIIDDVMRRVRTPKDVALDFAALTGITGKMKVRDVWNKEFLPMLEAGAMFKGHLPYKGSMFLVVMPADDNGWPVPFELAPWMKVPPPPVPPSPAL